MNVLIACEESQAVCIEMRRLGHRAFSCDIQDCSGGHPEWHIKGDVLPILNGNCEFDTADGEHHTQTGRWDLIIAHPPCTYLTSAGAVRLFDSDHNIKDVERERAGWAAREFFMHFYNADCAQIAIENPAPMKHFLLPRYSQIVEPYFFGDPWKKRTCLWLKGLPQLVPDNVVEPTSCWTVGGGGSTCRIRLKGAIGAKNQRERSKTLPGIARAMAEQWAGPAQHDKEEKDG